MKEFKATKYEDGVLELTSTKEMKELFDIIEKEENFVLEWVEGDVLMSQIMIGNNIAAKVKNGDISLTAKGGAEE